MGKRKTSILIIVLLLTTQFVSPALAQKAYLSDMVVTNTRDHLLVYFSVNECFTPEMNKAIENGLNTTFTFFVKLFEKRDYWWDTKITDLEVHHSIKYDNITKEYQFHFEETNHRLSVKDFKKAKEIMAKVNGAKLLPANRLEKGRKYYLDVKAEIDPVRLPFGLQYIFFFLSFWDVETDWVRYEFTY